MNNMKKGLLIVYSGPSGVGKGTILKELLPIKSLKLCFSVSMTTRKPRPGEIDGKDYFFVSKKRFEQAIKNKELIEYAEYVGNYYGTPKEYIEKKRNEGYNIILDIETKGAKQIKKKFKEDVVSIYIVPPSIEELKRRLIERGTESIDVINKRIAKTKRQLKDTSVFDYTVINDELKKATKEVKEIIKKEEKGIR